MKTTGRKPVLTERQKREVIRCVGTKKMSLRSAARHVVPNVSYGTILRIVRNSDMRYERMLKAPCLTKRHKEARLTFVKKSVIKGSRVLEKYIVH